MLEFRKSLPAHKEKETLLESIAQNQVFNFILINIFLMNEKAEN
jgi:hypothetical protein